MKKLVLAVILGLSWASIALPADASPQQVLTASAPDGIFAPARECSCHSAFVEQWSKSMHAQALTDPIYLAKKAEADKATDGALGQFCDSCHGPAATMLGQIGAADMSQGAADAVGCSFCHQVVGWEGDVIANTPHLVVPDNTRRAQIKDPRAPHSAAYSAFHESAEFCGGCHNVNHPINALPLEATYTEWKNSPYAEEGIVCQDCHMSEAPGRIGPYTGSAGSGGPERDNIYKMTFVGGNAILGPKDLATARLKSAATIELVAPEVLAGGESATAEVTVTNSGAGHYLPTGLTEVRQMSLAVYAEFPGGETKLLGERKFGTILADGEGNAPVELWEAEAIHSDDRIPPRESITENYSFTLDEGYERAKIRASLLYQSVPDELAEKAGVDNPVTTMAMAVQPVYANEDLREAALATQGTSETGGSALLVTALAVLGVGLVTALGFVLLRRRSA